MKKKHVAVLEFPEEYCALEDYCTTNSLPIAEFTIVACEPVLQIFLQKKQVIFENTLTYFPPHCHGEIIQAVEPLMESVRSLFRFVDKQGIKTSYSNEVAHYLRFYANHLFKMVRIIDEICDRYRDLTLYCFVSSSLTQSVVINDQDRFLGKIAELYCRQRKIPFVALVRSKNPTQSPAVVSRIGKQLNDFFSDNLARFFLSFLRGKNVIFMAPIGRSFRKMEKILKPLNPAYVILTLNSYNGWSLLWNILAITRRFIGWGPVRLFIPVLAQRSSVSSPLGQSGISVALDRAIESIPESVCTFAGIPLKPLLHSKARVGLFAHMEELVFQSETVFKYVTLCDRPILISHVGIDIYGVAGELFSLMKKPAVFVSHGGHPVPCSPAYEVELLNLCRGFMLGVFPVVALATPVQEAHLKYFKAKYDFVQSTGVRTGPLIFADLKVSEKRKARHALGLSEDECVVVHATTMKHRSGERFYFIETLDEFFVSVYDILSAIRSMERGRYILRLHPGFILDDEEIRTLLGNPSNLIIHRKGTFAQVLACADIIVSYSSTVIDEALLNNIPVLLYDRWSRYNHFKTEEFHENPMAESKKFFPVCYVKERAMLPKALAFLRDAQKNGGTQSDKAFAPYKFTKDYSANMLNFVREALAG